MPPIDLSALGSFIRDQRKAAEVSLRQLAKAAGVSNPYLSQIERGLRKPSADILQGIARGLQISSETLYTKAGLLDERPDDPRVSAAIMSDIHLDTKQKKVLIDIYETFCASNPPPPAEPEPSHQPDEPPAQT